MASREVTICNKKGLHARAAAKFVKCCQGYDCKVMVTRLGEPPAGLQDESLGWTVGGTSILGLMMLAAEPGVKLRLDAEGPQCDEVLDCLCDLIARKFDEGE